MGTPTNLNSLESWETISVKHLWHVVAEQLRAPDSRSGVSDQCWSLGPGTCVLEQDTWPSFFCPLDGTLSSTSDSLSKLFLRQHRSTTLLYMFIFVYNISVPHGSCNTQTSIHVVSTFTFSLLLPPYSDHTVASKLLFIKTVSCFLITASQYSLLALRYY